MPTTASNFVSLVATASVLLALTATQSAVSGAVKTLKFDPGANACVIFVGVAGA